MTPDGGTPSPASEAPRHGWLAWLRTSAQIGLTGLRAAYYRKVWGMTIGRGTRISGKAFLDFTNPRGIHIGEHTIVTPGARIFSHDFVGCRHIDTHIGSYCFIGANAIILPGVRVGNNCVVAAGAVVTQDIPDGSIVAGNPARIMRENLETSHFGITADGLPKVKVAQGEQNGFKT